MPSVAFRTRSGRLDPRNANQQSPYTLRWAEICMNRGDLSSTSSGRTGVGSTVNSPDIQVALMAAGTLCWCHELLQIALILGQAFDATEYREHPFDHIPSQRWRIFSLALALIRRIK